ncbi:MAG TPA: cation-transporting P-type ATPase, partial [Candidatus Babeliaceae bacterium]|nr:cation-transporting P-type ATPase [Candidatus Babeliaceae bacterium]
MDFYKKSAMQLEHYFQTSIINGLSEKEVYERIIRYGANTLPQGSKDSLFTVFLQQFKSPLLYILLAAVLLIMVMGNYGDALVIILVLMFNGIVGAIQEGRARTITQSLKQLVVGSIVAIRDGAPNIIEDRDLTLGDIIILQEGDKVPADARIIESHGLRVNESILTGESEAVIKQASSLNDTVSVSLQSNMVFKGTIITGGTARALVVAIGSQTYIGKLQESLAFIEEDMPLKREIERLAYWILGVVLVLCIGLLFVGLIAGRSPVELLGLLTALFIAVVPEGLPMVFTLVLASGARRMSRFNMLVKRLQAIEGLGRTDVIIIDKTGTLTRNEMMVARAYSNGNYYTVSGSGYSSDGNVFLDGSVITYVDGNLLKLAQAGALLDNAEIKRVSNGIYQVKGEPTEAALGVFAQKLGIFKQELGLSYTKVYDFPFDIRRKLHVALFKKEDTLLLMVAGSPESIMGFSHTISDQDRQALQTLLKDGFRVIGLACATISDDHSLDKNWSNLLDVYLQKLDFLGLTGIQDALRPDAFQAVTQARDSGLHIVMATGDHVQTGRYIAERTGILTAHDTIMEGSVFQSLTTDEKKRLNLERMTVFARVSPFDKLELVRLFQEKGSIVAMTGDGINDVPSLMAADLGIAMGISGTDMAKEAADLILLDDSFSSIIKAIEQGRHIFYTLRRVVLYFFSTNFSE